MKCVAQIVNEHGPLKNTELVTYDVIIENMQKEAEWDLATAIDYAVAKGLIREVEYILPVMDYRVKSLLFPARTQIRIVN